MRILVVGIQWPPEPFIARRLTGLISAGLRISVASPSRNREPIPGLEQVEHLSVARVGGSDADIVHFEWNSTAIDYLTHSELWARTVVISCRGTQLRIRPHVSPGYSDQLRETFDRAAAVHCVCETVRNEAVSLGLDASKAEIIYPAVDTTEFALVKRPPHAGALRLLSVGALIWTKGYEYAISTLRRLLDNEIVAHLEIIGDGNERERALYTRQELGLGEHVRILGAVPSTEVRARMQRADVFLHSSLSEGISNAVLEAMACGLPVVTSDAGGMREAVTDGYDGFVVATRRPGAAASAIARLARDPGLRATLGLRARRTVEARFQLEDQVSRFVDLYTRISGHAQT